MKNHNNEFAAEDWDDFTHSSVPSRFSNEEVFQSFKAFRELFRSLSKNELVERGWLKSSDENQLVARLFFGLTRDQHSALFRKSTSADESLVAMWLSLVRADAEYTCVAHQVPQFQSVSKRDLKSIAKLSTDVNVIKELPARLANYGIILVYLRGLTGMKLDGAVSRLSSGHMAIGMSFRYSRLDYFWFTLMHELAHLVLHGSVLDQPVFINIEEENSQLIEKTANKVAKEAFVDRISWRNCEPKYESGSDPVKKYAREQGVHPSIVAGLLRRELGNYTRYGEIINQYNVRDIIFGE